MALIQLIVSDLDRTLLRADKRISPYTAGVLAQCRERGILTAFATARPERATRVISRDFAPDFVIADNGALLLASGTLLSGAYFVEETKNRLLSTLRDFPADWCITAETGQAQYTNRRTEPWDAEDWNLIYCDYASLPTEPVTKISVQCPQPEFLREILKDFPELVLYGNPGEDWYQISRRDVTKWTAVQALAERQGMISKNVAAFGDDGNDIAMLAGCGLGIAVENASDPVKAAADAVCLHHQQDGVARWIQAHILSGQ